MEQYGFAKSFPIKSNWKAHLDGNIALHGASRGVPQIRFYRDDEMPRREE